MDCVFYRIATTPQERIAADKEWARLRAQAVRIRDVEEARARSPYYTAER
jgi:hypothetical protein